jgi:hypothetical protein
VFIITATWNDVIVGILIIIAGISAATTLSAAPSWANVVFGIWLIISPYVLGYGAGGRVAGNDVVVGIIVVIFALTSALSKPGLYGRPTEGPGPGPGAAGPGE